jgi:hypothetical protein
MIDMAAIEARIADLEQQRKNAEALVYGIDGALADSRWWLTQLPADEPSVESVEEE